MSAADTAEIGTLTTQPPSDPRLRTFLPLTRKERFAAFWWSVARRLFFVFTPSRLNFWRRWLLRLFGAKIDATAFIHPRAIIHYPWNLTMKPGSSVHHKAILECMGPITLGEGARVSQYVHMVSGTHDYTRRDMQIVCKPIVIGDNAWIAADVFVGAGVTVGDRTIVGARSGVFRDLPPDVVAVGNSAHPIHNRDEAPVPPAP